MIKIAGYFLNIILGMLAILILVQKFTQYRKRRRMGKVLVRLGSPYNFFLFIGLLWLYNVYLVLKAGHFGVGVLPGVLGYGFMGVLFSYLGLQAKTIREGGISYAHGAWEWSEISSYSIDAGYGSGIVTFDTQGNLLQSFGKRCRWLIGARDKDALAALLGQYLPGKKKDSRV